MFLDLYLRPLVGRVFLELSVSVKWRPRFSGVVLSPILSFVFCGRALRVEGGLEDRVTVRMVPTQSPVTKTVFLIEVLRGRAASKLVSSEGCESDEDL